MSYNNISIDRSIDTISTYTPGVIIAGVVGLLAHFSAPQYLPSMVLAVLFGLLISPMLGSFVGAQPGIAFSGKYLLQAAVICMGVRIDYQSVFGLDPGLMAVIAGAMFTILLAGYFAHKFLQVNLTLAVMASCSVAICGAAAATAAASVMPRSSRTTQELTLTVLCASVCGTLAMYFYPVIARELWMDDNLSGAWLGGTLHDIFGAIVAGHSISDKAGEVATLYKMMRVAMLAPIVIILALLFRSGEGEGGKSRKTSFLPTFLYGFIAVAILQNLGVFSEQVHNLLDEGADILFLTGMAAIGMQLSFRNLWGVGAPAFALVLIFTQLLAVLVYVGFSYVA